MYAEFTEIFNFRQDDAKGRSITLASVVLSALYNVFITGLFYTGFLSMYGMSITDAGIVTLHSLFRAVHVPDAGGDHAGDGGCAREQMARVYPAGGY